MQILVINLASATDRLQFQTAQLAALGLSFERVEAIDGRHDQAVADHPIWDTWERPMSRSERACLLSHKQIWRRIAEGTEPVLVLEDDVLLSRALPEVLKALRDAKGIEYVTLETRARKKLLSLQAEPTLPLRRLYQDKSGAAGYILWPSGARKLLERTETSAGLADAVLCSTYNLIAFQAAPPLAIQTDISDEAHIASPLRTHSSVARLATNRRTRNMRFIYRRIRNQIALGLRRLRYLLSAKQEKLMVNPSDFSYLERLRGR